MTESHLSRELQNVRKQTFRYWWEEFKGRENNKCKGPEAGL